MAGAYLVLSSAEKAAGCTVVIHGNYFSLPQEKLSASSITDLWHF